MTDNRATLDRVVQALIKGDWDTAGDILAEDAVVDWPQSGERIVGRQACLNVFRNYPGGPPSYELTRVTGGPDVFNVEAVGHYGTDKVFMTSIVEFSDGKVVRQTDYWSNPFPAPDWRAKWVEHTA